VKWFGRKKAKGRHALGAAVTSIPFGPLNGSGLSAPAPPVSLPAGPLAEPTDEPPPPAAPGPVHAAPLAVTVRPDRPLPSAASEDASAQHALDHALTELMLVDADAPLSAAPPAAAAAQRPVPPQPAVVPSSVPRVQLGFRDGTSTTLDPSSDQSQALELLAQSLTRRD